MLFWLLWTYSIVSYCYGRNSQKLGSSLLADTVKNYRSVSLLSCKQSLLVLSSNRKVKARVARAGGGKVGWPQVGWLAPRVGARGQVARGPHVAKRAKKAKRRVLCFEGLYNWWDRGEGVTYWLTGKSGASLPPRTHDYPYKYVWGSAGPNNYLLQTLFVHFAYVMEGTQ